MIIEKRLVLVFFAASAILFPTLALAGGGGGGASASAAAAATTVATAVNANASAAAAAASAVAGGTADSGGDAGSGEWWRMTQSLKAQMATLKALMPASYIVSQMGDGSDPNKTALTAGILAELMMLSKDSF